MCIRDRWWGTAVARTLHARALAAMRERGWQRARLFTPALHVRARRFYEREGWALHGVMPDLRLGLAVAEYRRAVG